MLQIAEDGKYEDNPKRFHWFSLLAREWKGVEMNPEEVQQPETQVVVTPVAELPEIVEAMGELKPFLAVPLDVTIELGRSRLSISELLDLGYHSVFSLDKIAGNNLDIYVNNALIGRGEVVVIEDKVGIKLNELVENHE
ncbi:MAG: flagellar motor switch protein FliN [Terriglobia bacterium]